MLAFNQTSPGFGSGLGYANRMYSSDARLKNLYSSSSSLAALNIGVADNARGDGSFRTSLKGSLAGSTSLPSICGPRLDLRGLSATMSRNRTTSLKTETQTYWESKVRKQRAAMRKSGLFQLDPLPPRSLALAMENAPSLSSSSRNFGSVASSRKSAAGKNDLALLEGAQDHDGWLSATLSSLPSPRRVVNHSTNAKSSPKSESISKVSPKAENMQSIQLPLVAPKLPSKIAKKELHIMFDDGENDSKAIKEEELPKAKRKAKRTATQFGVKGGRSVDEVLARDKARVAVAQGFTHRELARMRSAFRRYRPPDSTEVARDDLAALFKHLGYFGASAKKVDELASDVHEFNTFSFHDFIDIAEKFVAYERDQLLALFRKYSADEVSSDADRFDAVDSPASKQTVQTPTACLFPESPHRFITALETPTDKPNTRLSVEKLPPLMYELGIIPLKETIAEVLASSSADGRPRSFLTYDGFIRFMAVYRVTEGFKKEDIQRAQRVFRSYAKEIPNTPDVLEMATGDLSSALITLFGTYSSHMVEALVAKLSKLDEQESDDDDDDETSIISSPQNEASSSQTRPIRVYGITFHEFLIWGRRTLMAILEELRRDFEKHVDGRGHVKRRDLLPIMADVGFTLTQVALSEYLEDADLSAEDDLDFDQFYFFVCAVRERSGFAREEVDRLRVVFERYDYDGSGEIENMELLDLLRFLGYDTSLEDVYRFLADVDANANGSMDLPEFLRNLRIKREDDVEKVREGFRNFCEPATDAIPITHVGEALASVNQRVQEDILRRAIASQEMVQETMDFETFLIVSDMCRTEMADVKRKRAAFNQSDYEKLRKMFNERCLDEDEVLDKGEWLWLLKDLGIPIDYQDDRQRVYGIVEEARKRAIASGLEEDELGDADGETITLWLFLHMVRCIVRDNESQTVCREEGAMDKARFTRVEVNEFREVFKASVLRHRLSDDSVRSESSSSSLQKGASNLSLSLTRRRRCLQAVQEHGANDDPPPSREQMSRPPSSREQMSRPPSSREQMSNDSPRSSRSKLNVILGVANYGFLPLSAFLQLLSSISVDLSLEEQRRVKQKVSEISSKADLSLDFADFLLLMRWTLDENLGDCQAKFALGRKNSRIKEMSSDTSRRRYSKRGTRVAQQDVSSLAVS